MRILSILLLLACLTSNALAGFTTRSIFTPTCGLPGLTTEPTTNTIGDSSVAGRMWCYPFVPCTGITNANQIRFKLGDTNITNTTSHVGVGIYDASGNYIVRGIATYGSTDEQTTVSLTLTHSPGNNVFSLTNGTKYYQCQCSVETSGAGSFMTPRAAVTGFDIDTAWRAFYNAFASNRWGITDSSHYCDLSNAMPPETMGSLTTQSSGARPILLKIGTSTP